MGKAEKQPRQVTMNEAEEKKQKALKGIDVSKLTIEDLESLRTNVYNLRDYSTSVVTQMIRIGDAYRRYHYTKDVGTPTSKQNRTTEQDKRIQARAKEDFDNVLSATLMYFERIEEEIRAANKTLRN